MRIKRLVILTQLLIFLLPIRALALKPLSHEELYDTSGQATPTVSLKLSDDLTIDYFNQNVVLFEPRGEQYISIEKLFYGQRQEDGHINFITLVWPEPLKIIFEFDKYQNYPEGIGITVSDIMRTGPDGRPLPEYNDPNAPLALTPNTTYLRTKPAPATITTVNNLQYIALVGDKNGEPDWEAAADPKNQLMYYFQSGKQRVEILGYVYVWAH